jgi:hypothetical protein
MGDRRFAWFLCGFVVAVLLLAHTDSGCAQDTSDTDFSAATGESSQSGPPQSGGARPNVQDVDNVYGAPGKAAAVPQGDTSEGSAEQDQPDPSTNSGQRGDDQDGDSNFSSEPPVLNDGVLDTQGTPGVEDGMDSTAVNPDDPDPVALFENPPAPPDPLLLQIEDLDPIRDNRTPRRLFKQEPFDPVGIRIGSFVLFPELELGGSWYRNVFHAPSAKSDVALDVLPSARLVSNWGTNALEFRATGALSFYDQFQTEDDRDYLLEARGRLDITQRSNIQALISSQQTLEDRSALDASSVGTRATVLTDRAEVAYNQRFNRLSLQFRGSVADYSYGDTEDAGVVTNNQDRDYTAYDETARTTWELKPTLSPFVEVAVNQREYGEAAQSDLINRSSTGQRYRFGVSFGNTGEVLRGEVSLGYGVQTYDDARLHPLDGLIVDANATWRITDLTSVLFTASSDVSETTTTDVGGALYRALSVEVRHQLRSYLVASAGLLYSNQNSEDGIIYDNDFTETLGLEYYADRDTVLFGKYAHVNFDGVGVPNDYTGDEIHFGVRLRR